MKLDIEDLTRQAEEGYSIPCRSGRKKVDVFARSSCGDTFLHVAVARQNIKEITYLIELGLDINMRGDYLATPLYQACASGDVAIAGLLLKYGADPSIPDHRGDLPRDALFRKIEALPLPYLESLLIWSIGNPIS